MLERFIYGTLTALAPSGEAGVTRSASERGVTSSLVAEAERFCLEMLADCRYG